MYYRICEAKDVKTLEREVNELILAGWTPTGGLSVVESNASNWWYYQAMIWVGEGAPPGESAPQPEE